jgi:ectoine hydroxylase-related dioxygenase (phytanoyl-CoA dioxygenase family)
MWKREFIKDGYVRFPGLTPEPLVGAAKSAIACDLKANYDTSRQAEYDSRSYCPGISAKPEIMDLFLKSPIHEIVDEVLGIGNIVWGTGQIAIRKAHNCTDRIPPVAHIDGFAAPLNGVPPGQIYNHTALVGVFLTPVQSAFAGNFTVWPGSHLTYERYFRDRGPRAMNESMPQLELGQARQLMCDPGDVILAHYSLGHTAAVNTSDSDRIAVFFRIVLRSVEADRWRYLTHMWTGWRLV